MTEKQRNLKRFESLPKHKKDRLNKLALAEFNKPIKYREKPSTLLDIVEFKT